MRRSAISRFPASIISGFILMMALATAAFAGEKINVDANNVAIKGYDAVAYFTESRAMKGTPQYGAEWNGARWLFASATNRDLFKVNPDKYAPRYGGFCALGVAHGETPDVDPEQWTLVDGKLYFNYSQKYRDEFRNNIATNIKKADERWAVLNKTK